MAAVSGPVLAEARRRAQGEPDLPEIPPELMPIAAFRLAGLSAHDMARFMVAGGYTSWQQVLAWMCLGGYSFGDALAAVWDVFRNVMGLDILQTMAFSVVGGAFPIIKNVSRLITLVKLLDNSLRISEPYR